MKRKIFSVLLALVLALSLSLVTAVPAGAQDPLSPTVTFVTRGTGTAGWTAELAYSGLLSAKMTTISGDDVGMVRFEFAPEELTLDELTTLGYWEYVSARENPLDVFIDIWLDFDGDGVATLEHDLPGYMQAEPYYTVGAAPLNTWTKIDAMNLKWSTYVGPDDPYDAPTIAQFQTNNPYEVLCAHDYTITNWTKGVDFGPMSILRIDIRVGYGGTWANFTGYADDIGINDYTQVEPSGAVGMTAASEPAVIGISVSPPFIDFGAITSGASVKGSALTVSNIGNVCINVEAEINADTFFDDANKLYFYTAALRLNEGPSDKMRLTPADPTSFGKWAHEDFLGTDPIVVSGSRPVLTKLECPSPIKAATTYTGTVVFWAEQAP